MRQRTIPGSVAAAVFGLGFCAVAMAQETDTTLNAFTTVKLEIKDGTNTTRGCKAVYGGSYRPSNPSSNPFQVVVEVDPNWHAIDVPTTSTVRNAKVTFKTGSGEKEHSFSANQQRDNNLIASKFVRIVNQSNLLNELANVTGNLRVTVEGDPIEYTYNVGQMGLAFAALETCTDSLGPGPSCEIAGPQTPRDIADKRGEHRITFGFAPAVASLNLCNIHFHTTAEHKGPGFSEKAPGEGGYLCKPVALTKAEKAEPVGEGCEAEPGLSKLKPGDTIEVHWVYSSCDVKPGKGLDSCSSKSCANPALRVESQVFMLVNDPSAAKISDYDYVGEANTEGMHQAKALPAATGAVLFRGSTTGRKYNDKGCSPYQATWNVRPACAKLDINSLNKWCEKNVFKEKGGHDVRELVTEIKRLDPIQ